MIEGWGLAVAAGVGAAATIGGSIMQSGAAKSAAQDTENAAESATQAQLQMFNTTQANYKNQIALGGGASQLLENLFGTSGASGKPNYASFNNSPGYQFALQQGQSAINRNAAASGGLYSSNTLGAQSAYAAGQASTQYNSYVNQLLSAAGLGNAAASGVGQAATATGGEIGGNAILAGNAAGLGALGSANAFSNSLNSVAGLGGDNNLLAGLINSSINSGSSFTNGLNNSGSLGGSGYEG